MKMAYEEFMKIIPEETKQFIKNVLPQFELFYNQEKQIYIDNILINNSLNKDFLIFLFSLMRNEDFKNIIVQCGYNSDAHDKNRFNNCQLTEEQEKNIFDYHASSFLIYDDVTLYSNISPLDLLINSIKPIYDNVRNSNFDTYTKIRNLFNCQFSSFYKSLIKINENQKDETENEIKNSLFKNLSIDAVDYLETASKIRTLIIKKRTVDNDLITSNEEDIVALSLLLAIFFANKKMNNEDSLLQQFSNLLNLENITLNGILKTIGINFDSNELEKTPINLYALKQEYNQYFSQNENNGVLDIVKNLFNRKTIKSLIIEKIFLNLGSSTKQFENPEQLIKSQAINSEKKLLLEFYKDLPKETKDFINYAEQAYLLIKKALEKNPNQKFLIDENDILLLAFYLSSKHFKTKLSVFFDNHNVTMNNILKLLNIEINLDEIPKQKIDYQILNSKFKRLVFKGENENISSSRYIDISKVETNLCNKSFTNSSFLHNIFEELTTIKLNNSFYKQVVEFINNIEKVQEKKGEEDFFKDMPIETVYFLELVSRVFNSKDLNGLDINDKITVSLLIGIIANNETWKHFFEYLGISVSKIKEFLGLRTIDYGKKDFNVLKEYFKKYIFDGYNKDVNRSELTIYNIAKNIFVKDFNDSLFINKLFAFLDVGNELCDEFDELYKKFLIKKMQEDNEKALYEKRKHSDTTEEKFLVLVLKFHKKLSNIKNIDTDDIKSIAIILYLFYINSPLVYYLNKNGITKETIFNFLNLPNDFFDDLENIEIDADVFIDYYQNLNTDDIKKIFIGPQQEIKFVQEMAKQLNVDLNVLQTEIKTEQDYEMSLSVNERIKLLEEKPVDQLDINDIQSVIKFGDSLGIHSKYIYDELPKLMLSDSNDESISSINDTISKVYLHPKKEEKPKSLWEKLFAFEVEEEKVDLVLDPIAIEELKEKITQNIKKLSSELLNYDIIRRYIEVYRRKNEFYLSKISAIANSLQSEAANLNPDKDDEYAEFLSTSSNLQMLKNKINRFKTSSQLMRQELIKVNQAIINHFITINALEMARDDLLPLINAEVAISKGRESENQALQTTQNIFDLFQSLLMRNAEAASQNLKQLQNSSLSKDILMVLSQDIETYLTGLNQISLPDNNTKNNEKVKNLVKKEQ